jgi:hypothetical protein
MTGVYYALAQADTSGEFPFYAKSQTGPEPLAYEDIPFLSILEPDFLFREQVFYRVSREIGGAGRQQQSPPIGLIATKKTGGQCRTRTCGLLLVRQAL